MSISTATTLLFVPGDRPERFDKAAAAGADVVVLDLEDAVAPDAKISARAAVLGWLPTAPQSVAVRINAAGTPWHDDDVAALAGHDVAVLVPKADPAAVTSVTAALPGTEIVALVETAAGVLAAGEVAQVHGVVRLAIGTFDLAAEIGVDPDDAAALATSRGLLVLASAATGLPSPVDGVTADVRDEARIAGDVARARALGFGAKLCIHPAQVAPTRTGFAPGPDEIAWATRVVEAASDDAVVAVDGRMVDAPVVARARRILAAAPATETETTDE